MIWKHYNPVRIVSTSLDVLAEYVTEQHVLLVTSNGFVKRGVVDRVKRILSSHKLTVLDSVRPNPELKDLDEMVCQLESLGIGFVVGLGGGSVLDTAKVLACTIPNPELRPLAKAIAEGLVIQCPTKLPMIAIPTTSGTGAEVTPYATIWDHEQHKKYSFSGEFVYPNLAILDPSLTLTMGHEETTYTALDAISHALESLWNRNRTPLSQAFAIQSLTIAKDTLPALLKYPTSEELRRKMQISSCMAGIAISQTQTALAHSISYPLTLHFGVPHGLACSFMLPKLIDHYMINEPKSDFLSLMKETRLLLQSLDLRSKLINYVGNASLYELVSQMHTPGRADNLSVPMPDMQFILE
jgi:phosphonate metabolism-associated iron-containing alcohol dehydrogenase